MDEYSFELERRMKIVEEAVVYIRENYVQWKTFSWALGVAFTVIMATLGGIWISVLEVRDENYGVKQEVAELNGRLEPFQFILE